MKFFLPFSKKPLRNKRFYFKLKQVRYGKKVITPLWWTERNKKHRREREKAGQLEIRDHQLVQILVAAAAIAFVLNTFIIANSRVPSASMENTIMTGSRVIGSRLSYHFHEPERGDVVIFVFGYDCKTCGTTYQETPEGVCPVCGRADKRNSTIYYVKRIIVCQVTPSTSKTVTST